MSEPNETLDDQERLLLDAASSVGVQDGEFLWEDAYELELRGLVTIVMHLGDGRDDEWYELIPTPTGRKMAEELAYEEAGLRGEDHDA